MLRKTEMPKAQSVRRLQPAGGEVKDSLRDTFTSLIQEAHRQRSGGQALMAADHFA